MKKAPALAITAACAVLAVATAPMSPSVAHPHDGKPGAPGAGDPYFPLDGNGGYDVGHYDLALRYHPGTGRAGRAGDDPRPRDAEPVAVQPRPRRARRCTGSGSTARRATGRAPGRSSRSSRGTPLRKHRRLHRARSGTAGCRELLEGAGFIATDDGFDIAGQPHVAASWFPVNDHPTDKASYTFRVTVPQRARGRRQRRPRRQALATAAGRPGPGDAPDPMASYLATVDVGEFRLDQLPRRRHPLPRRDRPRPVRPGRRPVDRHPVRHLAGGGQLLQAADAHHRRPRRRSHRRLHDHPRHRARLGLRLRRGAHRRARTTGRRCATSTGTPPRTPATPASCGRTCTRSSPSHYQTVDQAAETCDSDRGHRRVVGGDRRERRAGAVAGRPRGVRRQHRRALDQLRQRRHRPAQRRVRRRHRRLDRRGHRRRSSPGSTAGPCPARPPGSPGNENDWIVGTVADVPPPRSARSSTGSLARQPEIIGFLSRRTSGRYPWRDAGGIVDDVEGLGFALETQTRPIYSKDFFTDSVSGDAVVVHELAHQWYGDSLAVQRWKRHLAQRGLRDLRRVALVGARGTRHRAGDLRLLLQRLHPRRRPVVGHHHRRSRARPALRVPGLLPRRHDPARAAADTSGTRTSSGSSRCGLSPGRVTTSPRSSSSTWPSGSPASTSTSCSTPGSTPRASLRSTTPLGETTAPPPAGALASLAIAKKEGLLAR